MSIHVTYHVDHPDLPIISAARAAPDARFAVDRILTTDGTAPVVLLWVTPGRADGGDPRATVEAGLDADPTVIEWALLETDGDEGLYRVAVHEEFRDRKRLLIDAGGVPDGAEIDRTGWCADARFPDRDSLAAFRDACVDAGVSFRTERLTAAGPTERTDGSRRAAGAAGDLTAAQREALVVALEMGYFDVPRRASTADVADALGLSTSAASSRLRRGQRRVLAGALDGERRRAVYKPTDRSASG